MAQATGFTCDNPTCGSFAVGIHDGSAVGLPEGWITMTPSVKKLMTNPTKKAAIELCGNRCVAEVAIMRWEADNPGGKRFMRSAASRALSAAEGGGDE